MLSEFTAEYFAQFNSAQAQRDHRGQLSSQGT